MALGLERAGMQCVGAIERDERAGETFRRNLWQRMAAPRLLALGPEDGDVRRIDFSVWAHLLNEAGHDQLDLLEGGPPCQSFSRVGRGKLNNLQNGGFRSDARNGLWRHFFEAVCLLQPKMFIVENVPGMLHHGGINVAEQVCKEGRAAGYRVSSAVLNSAAFGVPQTRERLFILGVQDRFGIDPSFPSGDRQVLLGRSHFGFHPTAETLFDDPSFFQGALVPHRSALKAVTVREALGDLPPFLEHMDSSYRASLPCPPVPYRKCRPSNYAKQMREWPGLEAVAVTDHICKATPRDYETFARMEPGDRYPRAHEIAESRYEEALSEWSRTGRLGTRPRQKDYVPPYPTDQFPEKWQKLIPSRPSWTVTAHLAKDSYSHIHYDSKQARMITIREAARLQSFPDGFEFCGNIGERFRQVGNAVPPVLAAGVGVHLLQLLNMCGAGIKERSRLVALGMRAALGLARRGG